jgi:DNA-damage-inducible protein J
MYRMSHSAVVHARIDSSTKETTEKILHSLGLTPTEAIRLFYRQIALRGEFPLELRVPNSLTAEVLTKADRGEDLERFESVDELYASWNQ